MTVANAFPIAVSLLLTLAGAQSPSSPPDPLLAEIRSLKSAILAVCNKPDQFDDAAQLRFTARYRVLQERLRQAAPAWSPQWIGEAFAAQTWSACDLHVENRVLVGELEHGMALLRSHAGPWHGLASLLALWTDLSHVQGSAAHCAREWEQLVEDWEHGPKKAWLCAEAARRLINKCHMPDLAVKILGNGLDLLSVLPEWPEQVRSLLADPDVWITMPERPAAGSRTDCRGQLHLLRGFALLESNRLHEALDALIAARRDLTATGNQHRLVNVEHNLAAVWLQLGRIVDAIETAEHAEGLYAQPKWQGGKDDNGVRAMRWIRAQGLVQRGKPDDLEQARGLLVQMGTPKFLENPGETSVEALCVWAGILLAGDMPPRDAVLWEHVLTSLRRYSGPRRLTRLLATADLLDAEWALRRNTPTDARTHLDAAAAWLEQQQDLALRVRLQCLSGQVHLADQQPKAAMTAYLSAGQLIHTAIERERLWSFDDGIVTFQQLHAAALRGAYEAYLALVDSDPRAIETLYEILQQFHGYESACLWLGLATGIDESTLTTEDREHLASLRRDVRRLHDDLSRKQRLVCDNPATEVLRDEEVSELKGQIESASVGIAALRAKLVSAVLPQPASLAEVQHALHPGELLLECVDLGNRLVVLGIDHEGAEVREHGCDRKELVAAVDECRRWSTEHDAAKEAAHIKPLAKLAKLLMPTDGWLDRRLADPKTKTLMLSPEGPLCRVPFAALPWRAKPLVEHFALGHVISGTTLARQRRRKLEAEAAPGQLLVLGNPWYPESGVAAASNRSALDASNLPPLPGTAFEALAVARKWATPEEMPRLELEDPRSANVTIEGRNFRVLLGTEARESALRPELLEGVRFLHLACHARADVESPPMSFLALTLDPNPPDGAFGEGLLRLGEFVKLRGDYELLTLSACETGAGVIRGHEGPASLARAGQAAGARRVLSTLWRVGDAAAHDLVVEFYHQWRTKSLPAAQALANAQRKAIGTLPVRDWAAFALWGEVR